MANNGSLLPYACVTSPRGAAFGQRCPAAPDGRRSRRLFGLTFLCACVVVLAFVVAQCRSCTAALGRVSQLAVIWVPAGVSRTPEAIVASLQASGPVFIKLAQWLSTRRDLLSDELCDAMSALHERVHCSFSPEELRAAEELVPTLQVKDLLGGGCIAQVYLGQMQVPSRIPGKSNFTQEVAVKVRRRDILFQFQTDMQLLRWVARWAEWWFPQLQWLAMEKAVDNFGWYLEQQVDLRVESQHARRFGENFRTGITRVPKVRFESEAILVTDIAPGVSLSQFVKQDQPKEIRKEVFEALTDLMAKMILRDNFIHGDLHPGNVFVALQEPGRQKSSEAHNGNSSVEASSVKLEPRITLIDAGIAIEMSANLTRFARNSMLAAFRMDAPALGHSLVKLHEEEGLCGYGEDLPGLEHKVGHLLLAGCFMCDQDIWGEVFPSWEAYNGTRVSEYFTMLVSYLSRHKVRVSPSLWSLMTAFALIEGSVQELGYGVNVLRAAAPYIFAPMDYLGRFGSALTLGNSERKHRSGAIS